MFLRSGLSIKHGHSFFSTEKGVLYDRLAFVSVKVPFRSGCFVA